MRILHAASGEMLTSSTTSKPHSEPSTQLMFASTKLFAPLEPPNFRGQRSVPCWAFPGKPPNSASADQPPRSMDQGRANLDDPFGDRTRGSAS